MIQENFDKKVEVTINKDLEESRKANLPNLNKDLDPLEEIRKELKNAYHKRVLENKYIKEIVSPSTGSEPAETIPVESRKKVDDRIKEIKFKLENGKISEEVKKDRELLNELKNYIKLNRHYRYTVKFIKCEEGRTQLFG